VLCKNQNMSHIRNVNAYDILPVYTPSVHLTIANNETANHETPLVNTNTVSVHTAYGTSSATSIRPPSYDVAEMDIPPSYPIFVDVPAVSIQGHS